MIIDENKLHKRAFESELKYIYDIKRPNRINDIHDNEVNKIYECNLLHDILNPSKLTKNINSHYSPILHGFMNTIKGKAKFNNFRILLNSGCSSTIVMLRLIKNLFLKNTL